MGKRRVTTRLYIGRETRLSPLAIRRERRSTERLYIGRGYAAHTPRMGATMDTPHRRYVDLSAMLSGVSLHPDKPAECHEDFYDPQIAAGTPNGAFCGRWTTEDIAQMLSDIGCLQRWQSYGFSKIWIEFSSGIPRRHTLEVWTQTGETSELLMQLVVWLDYLTIDRLQAAYPVFHVEHLRLQRPGMSPGADSLPGQDFASSGLLRQVFGIVKKMACALGASLISEIPQYFHTAYIFSEFFVYADSEMEMIFRAAKRDLMTGNTRLCDVSRAFERGQVLWKGQTYLWPTEVQVCALSHELARSLAVPADQIVTEPFKIQQIPTA